MIAPFSFSRLPLILFGNGKIKDLPRLVRSFGASLMLVTGRSSFTGSHNGRELMESLSAKGIKYQHIIIDAEPTPEMIDGAVASARNDALDVIVAVGGGSVIDAGKAISAMIPLQEPVMDYLEGVGTSEHPGRKIPFIAVPTTSGTGSEATKNAVLSRVGPAGFKKSLRHDAYVPDAAIIDKTIAFEGIDQPAAVIFFLAKQHGFTRPGQKSRGCQSSHSSANDYGIKGHKPS